MHDACTKAFGKPRSKLTAEEEVLRQRAARLASYYRQYEKNKARQREGKRDAKQRIIAALGWESKCMQCGYDRYVGALEFHHLDRDAKEFTLAGRTVEAALDEARKCRLLCSNCHKEAHAKSFSGGFGPPRRDLDPRVLAYLRAVGIDPDVR